MRGIDGRDPKRLLRTARNRLEAAAGPVPGRPMRPCLEISPSVAGRDSCVLSRPHVWIPECGPQSANGLWDGEDRTTTRLGCLQGQGSERRDVTRTGVLAPLEVGLNGACDTVVPRLIKANADAAREQAPKRVEVD